VLPSVLGPAGPDCRPCPKSTVVPISSCDACGSSVGVCLITKTQHVSENCSGKGAAVSYRQSHTPCGRTCHVQHASCSAYCPCRLLLLQNLTRNAHRCKHKGTISIAHISPLCATATPKTPEQQYSASRGLYITARDAIHKTNNQQPDKSSKPQDWTTQA
jgi:hypothetical protein